MTQSMQRFLNTMRMHAARQDAMLPVPRWGTVESVDPSRPAVKVMLQPEGVLSGWLPVAQPFGGAGWSLLCPAVPGDQAFCVPDSGSPSDYVVVGFAHNDGAQPPQPANAAGTGGTPSSGQAQVVSGEIALVSKAGGVLRLCADGSLYIRGNVGIDGTLAVNGNVNVQQNIFAVEDITDQNNAHGTLGAFRTAYDNHAHGGIEPGAGDSGTTTLPV